MNCFSYLLLMVLLSSLSLMIVIILRVSDLTNVDTKQKILLIKTGLLVLGASPFIFIFLSLFSWHGLEITLIDKFTNQLPAPIEPVKFIGSNIHWPFYVVLIYSIGSCIMFSRILCSFIFARKQLLGSSQRIIQEQIVFLNAHIQSPLSFGFPTAKIYFPKNAEKNWTARELQMSLAHEKVHLDHNDSSWKLFSLVVRAFLFFGPWSYYLHRKLELEMEIFCDERTRAKTGADIKEYGNLLLAMTCVQPKNLIFTNMTDSTLKRRILAMKSRTKKRPFFIFILCATFLLTGSVAIATTSGITEKSIFKITTKMFVDGRLISSPRVITYSNQKAVITISDKNGAQSLRMQIVARDDHSSGTKNAIRVNFNIQYKNGTEKFQSEPEIITAPNQENTVNLSSNESHAYEMHVLAVRQ